MISTFCQPEPLQRGCKLVLKKDLQMILTAFFCSRDEMSDLSGSRRSFLVSTFKVEDKVSARSKKRSVSAYVSNFRFL